MPSRASLRRPPVDRRAQLAERVRRLKLVILAATAAVGAAGWWLVSADVSASTAAATPHATPVPIIQQPADGGGFFDSGGTTLGNPGPQVPILRSHGS